MYYWNDSNIEESLNKLKRIDLNTLNKKDRNKIQFFLKELSELSEQEEKMAEENKAFTYLDFIAFDIEYFKQQKFLINDLINFGKNEFTALPLFTKFTELSLSNDQLLEITHDFYKDQDKEIFNAFLKAFDNKDRHIRFSNDESSYTTGIPFIKDIYMQLSNENNLQSIIIAIHEFAHATSFMLNDMHLCEPEKSFLAEFDSTFAELIAIDFLKENYNIGEEDYYLLLRNDLMINNARMISDKYEIAKFQKSQNIKGIKRLEKELRNNLGLTSDYTEVLIDVETEFEVPYIIGYMFAIELYTFYKKDKEKALFILKEFIKAESLSKKGYYKYLELLGLTPNINTKTFIKNINNDYSLLLKK